MHANTLMAYDMDGARYCLDCCRELGIDTTQDKPESGYGGPVFASDLESGETCSECWDYITEPDDVPEDLTDFSNSCGCFEDYCDCEN